MNTLLVGRLRRRKPGDFADLAREARLL